MPNSDTVGWFPLQVHMRLLEDDAFYQELMEILTVHRSRRTVQVATRKYRARRKRS